jgi:S-adenosylmethionine-diacylglycerol 3-amino-3-carboxypropyl transferase
MSRAYSPEFFAQVGRQNFAEHFLALARHALTDVPIADNYFLHQMFRGRYPVDQELGVPPYLGEEGFNTIASGSGQLTLVDGSMTSYLETLAPCSVNVFALSNICEWLEPRAIAGLFAEVERVAAPGARIVFRNFVGWTQLPQHCTRLVADAELGRALMQSDRSCVQPRAVVCRVAE